MIYYEKRTIDLVVRHYQSNNGAQKMALTINQANMINAIAFSEFQPLNGGEPEKFEDTDWIWAEFIIETSSDKGTFTSLVNAGLVEHNGHDDQDACVRLTERGFQVFRSFYNY